MFDEKYYLDIYQDKTDDELFDLFERKGLTDEARDALNKIFITRGVQPPSPKERVESYKNNIHSLNKMIANRPRSIIFGISLIIIPCLIGLIASLLISSHPPLVFNIFGLLIALLISYGVYDGRSWGVFWAYKLLLFVNIIFVAIAIIVSISGASKGADNIHVIVNCLIFSIYTLLIKLSLYYKSSKSWFKNCAHLRKLIKIENNRIRELA